MIGIQVTVEPATEANRLHPHYKNSIGILTLESARPSVSSHGVTIDGTLVIDFYDNKTLIFV